MPGVVHGGREVVLILAGPTTIEERKHERHSVAHRRVHPPPPVGVNDFRKPRQQGAALVRDAAGMDGKRAQVPNNRLNVNYWKCVNHVVVRGFHPRVEFGRLGRGRWSRILECGGRGRGSSRSWWPRCSAQWRHL
jgi:hypothetical protein